MNNLTNPESLLLLYIAFLAYDKHVSKVHSSQAGSYEDQSSKTTTIAYEILANLVSEAGESIDEPEHTEIKETLEKHVQELVRANGGELHNIAAATGGMVAQEVIKVITKQYIPVDNTCIFDGIQSRSSVLRL